MNLVSIIFSPTGGTRKISRILADALGFSGIEIDLMGRVFTGAEREIRSQDLCLIAVPSFGGRVPPPALARIAALRGNGAPAVLVVSYGNRAYEDTLRELKDAASAAGFLCLAAVAAVAQHSTMGGFAAGRPDGADREELVGFGERIRDRLLEEGKLRELRVPGNNPYRDFAGSSLHPAAGRACNRCGTCAQICPTGAIPLQNPKRTNSALCIGCMGCVAVCPRGARALDPVGLSRLIQKLGEACGGRKPNELMLYVSSP